MISPAGLELDRVWQGLIETWAEMGQAHVNSKVVVEVVVKVRSCVSFPPPWKW